MTYYIYHIPGKKIGVTRDLKKRVEEQQGYGPGEYSILMKSDNISYVSEQEIYLQEQFGYRIDDEPYNELKFNKMNINVTEQTTTFPCPINKLKGRLMDNIDMEWETEHGKFNITPGTIKWIMNNVVTSKYNPERCYVYNKAFARYYDNNDPYRTLADLHMRDEYPRTGGLARDCGPHERKCEDVKANQFDLIRKWANKRGLYEKGDPKTQTL